MHGTTAPCSTFERGTYRMDGRPHAHAEKSSRKPSEALRAVHAGKLSRKPTNALTESERRQSGRRRCRSTTAIAIEGHDVLADADRPRPSNRDAAERP